ncbi:CAX-interacting protein 4 [Acorus calamus]|uniref:CAX-interacting protein 4 n=1 Tax=Acorus calamus TaxID=4465 RepID=A0AAV9F7H1_ACOCL|nr:CAX-interacting protein 4 [Acorus calamus]
MRSHNAASPSVDAEAENAHTSFQGLLDLARITGSNADETRGACKRCGRVGCLTKDDDHGDGEKYGVKMMMMMLRKMRGGG